MCLVLEPLVVSTPSAPKVCGGEQVTDHYGGGVMGTMPRVGAGGCRNTQGSSSPAHHGKNVVASLADFPG